MGLGLFIARNIIEAHQGAIWAENNADKGAAFGFKLPPKTNGYLDRPPTPKKRSP
jgi:two-component system NarL family sensor kinase